jgi:hypothetical protein
MSTTKLDPKTRYTLDEAADFLGIKRFHMHELVLPHGDKPARIPATKLPHPRFPKIQRWMVLGSDIAAYAANRKSGVGKRSDGRNKWTVYADAEELAKIEAFCKANNLPAPKRANPPKSK